VALGLIAFAAAIIVGRLSAKALAAISSAPSDAVEIRHQFITSVATAEGVGVLAVAAAIVVLIVGEASR
jgi:F0F1-type ATP synthase membrane subunit c/vacuolar-type H+-ATPase subunit K